MTMQQSFSSGQLEPLDIRALALRSLRRKQDFVGHLMAYVGVNALLVTIWFVTGLTSDSWFPWPLIPMVGWGIGLAFHALAVYGRGGRPPTERAIQREVERLNRI